MKQRVAARLLLATCTLALGLGLGTAVAVTGLLALRHPALRVSSPGQADGRLDRGRHELFVLRNEPGGEPPVSESRPGCAVTNLGTGRLAPLTGSEAGFAAVAVERGGRHRVACTSTIPLTVGVRHEDEGAGAHLGAIGRGLLLAVVFTALAALLAGRALVTAGRLRRAEDEAAGEPPP